VGVIGVATHWDAPQFAEMIGSFAKGDVLRARQVNELLIPSFAFETGDAAPNPIPAKAMMRVLGLPVGQCRLPMGPAPDGLEARAREVLAGCVPERMYSLASDPLG
ncbi:MAG: dihydrodipicolinate synthase family protein, partial [Actinomycetota bacterium]|nr:dihydrodipicolinate synthase family protein [Actinomycetota bacterium]